MPRVHIKVCDIGNCIAIGAVRQSSRRENRCEEASVAKTYPTASELEFVGNDHRTFEIYPQIEMRKAL